MDVNSLKRAVQYHGSELMDALHVEQGERFTKSLAIIQNEQDDVPLSTETKSSRERMLISFIAKKADMLFGPTESAGVLPVMNELDYKDYYAILPPMESFMNVDEEARKHHFYHSLSKGDVVVGSVFGKHTHGLIIRLLCLSAGKMRYIHDLQIKCFCNVIHIPPGSAHEDPLEAYEINDLIQGVVLDVQPINQKIYISMKDTMMPFGLQLKFKLGHINEDVLPIHYKKSLELRCNQYGNLLDETLGFMNPNTVAHLSTMMGLDVNKQLSFMRGLHMKVYPKEDFAAELYKVQCANWAYKSVEQGVHYFKLGNSVEAFQCLNKALQIDPLNVEALVARGALYANGSSFSRAMEDFYKALDLNPNHSNAIKFSVETLIALGKQHEERNDPAEAIKCYRKVLILNPSHSDALQHMKAMQQKEDYKRNQARQNVAVLDSNASCSKNVKEDNTPCTTDTKEKLKQLLSVEKTRKFDVRSKTKKYIPSDTSSWSSSSSSSSGRGFRTRRRSKRSSDDNSLDDSSSSTSSSRSSRSRYGHRSRGRKYSNTPRERDRRNRYKSTKHERKRRKGTKKYSKDRRKSRSSSKTSSSAKRNYREDSDDTSSTSCSVSDRDHRSKQSKMDTERWRKSESQELLMKNAETGKYVLQGCDNCVSPYAANSSYLHRTVSADSNSCKQIKQLIDSSVDSESSRKNDGDQTLEELESFVAILKAKKYSKVEK